MSEEKEEKIVFKPKKKKPTLRKRENSDDEEESEEIVAKVEEMKEIQRLRRRPNGVSVVGLALGKKISIEEETALKDPFKINSGGLINMSALKNGKIKTSEDAYDTGIGTQFSAETNKRDEDEEMMKYIEEKLSRKKGQEPDDTKPKTSDTAEHDQSKYFTPEEAALQAVPNYLRESTTQRSEEMLSNQMLSGIPEVDLGIEAKIRNIEATEEAKLRLLWEKHHKKDGPSQFVPTNMAVNFVQHNRFNIEENGIPKRKRDAELKQTITQLPDSSKKSKTEKATDDYHYEKFKKQFRRY
ncbi:telomere length and silencing protein 1 homolog isoform X2 [Chrysoperla carnea]|uniref:telomere length and silencing protein 1 homolog isoform X2 n=1 Tax=Chrysoperla carnea TaxID=189513 RepID=UPI001D076E4C|nr:telomere length and silencing protein 1 homolog isoform X2 [Chrysoperla carnea]